MAVCRWVTDGGPPTTVIVSLLSDGSANLNLAAADQGTGTKTVMAMVVAEELGVPIDKVRVEQGDTGTTQFGKSGGGSHSVLVYAPAVRSAAMQVKTRLLELAAVEFGCATSELFLKDGSIIRKSGEAKRLSELKGLAEQEQITGMGQPPPEPSGKLVCSFGAQFAEVEANMRTGEIRVLRLVAAHDSGRVMNRQTCESQVFGGMAMGIGFGLTEKRIMDEQTGRMVNANWHDYKIPTAKDVPFDQECLMIDPADSLCNSVGAKGLGEPTTVPTAPAIANAIAHATGFRFRQSPITPMQLIEARRLHEGG